MPLNWPMVWFVALRSRTAPLEMTPKVLLLDPSVPLPLSLRVPAVIVVVPV